ncbi:MAG TPA: hypothetical protein VNO30_18020 [Kofleriaceae bacterium]|nr:hypothetical protein [Kofleriaceae bacterium]
MPIHRRARLRAASAVAAFAAVAVFVLAVFALAAGAAPAAAAPGAGSADKASARPAPASGAVALLPLDAGGRLEIYGQAVATEIARALTAGGVEVVVVGASMDVPAAARLIVAGTLAMDKGLVSLSMLVRNPIDGTVLETLTATAPSLAQIDKAAAELAARVVPVVRERLAALAARPAGERAAPRPAPIGAAPRALLVAIGGAEPLRAALAGAAERWALAARRELRATPPQELAGGLGPRAVAAANAERAIGFEIVDYSVVAARGARDVPLARARVRVQISDASGVVFDRVVTTDSIVGERRMQPAELAARVADEVLAILRPHVRRAVSPWP